MLSILDKRARKHLATPRGLLDLLMSGVYLLNWLFLSRRTLIYVQSNDSYKFISTY